MMEFPPAPAGGWSRDTRKQFEGNTMAGGLTVGPELRLLNLHFFNICRHHPTLKFKPHATDDERYVSGIDGVPLRNPSWLHCSCVEHGPIDQKQRNIIPCPIRRPIKGLDKF